MKEINEDPIIEKDLEVEIVETVKEELMEEVVNDIDEVKLNDCNVQAPTIWWETPKQSLLILLGWKDLMWLLTLIW